MKAFQKIIFNCDHDGWMKHWLNTYKMKCWKKCVCCSLSSYKKAPTCITSLTFSSHVHTIPGYGFNYCSNIVSDLSHFTALKTGEWLSKPMLSKTTKMFMHQKDWWSAITYSTSLQQCSCNSDIWRQSTFKYNCRGYRVSVSVCTSLYPEDLSLPI